MDQNYYVQDGGQDDCEDQEGLSPYRQIGSKDQGSSEKDESPENMHDQVENEMDLQAPYNASH